MIMARDRNGKAIPATRNANGTYPEAFCPCCRKRMRARVGEIRRPHWAHESGERCDEWWEDESDWRDGWLQVFSQSPNVDIENVLEKNGERHFYDARFGNSLVAVFDGQDCRPSNLRNVKHSSARCFGLSRLIRVNTSVFDGRFIIIR